MTTQSAVPVNHTVSTSVPQRPAPGPSMNGTQRPGACQPQHKSLTDRFTDFWRDCTRDWYPKLHSQTYFLPPLHFNRVSYDFQSVAGQSVPVPTPGNVPVNPVPSGPFPQPNPPPLACQAWDLVPPGDPVPRVQDSDVTDDRAMQLVLDNIRELAERRQEVMMVISQLEFRKYLDNQVDPITAAATRLPIPRPDSLGPSYEHGDFDLLMINRRYGLIIGEVKSVGADPQYSTDQAVARRVQKAVKQLNKSEVVLRHLVSDLAPVNVTKILMLPNATCAQLQQALDTNPHVEQDLCQCVGAPDTAAAVARCLCADSLQNKSSVWWERAVTDHGHDGNMTDDIYETLVARFAGPATTVEVPTVTTPTRRAPLRTMAEAVALTGLTMVTLTLQPEQVDLINRPDNDYPRVFLHGPPGTGKTVVLGLKGIQWGQQKDVHLLSSHENSRAAILLIERQLLHALGTTATPAAAPRVHRHMYDFKNNEGDVETAVNTLAAAACTGELYVLADEAHHGTMESADRFHDFCEKLNSIVPKLYLWAAAVEHNTIPKCMKTETLTYPLRSPPSVIAEVEQSGYFGFVPKYFRPSAPTQSWPAPTDGPPVRTIRHHGPDHNGAHLPPEDCDRCADAVVDLMDELHVGGQKLQYRDTFILCQYPRQDMAMVKRLQARNKPVQVVTTSADDSAVIDVALATADVITVTDRSVVTGLERRIVIVMEDGAPDLDTLHSMSRSTSLLVRVSR